MHEVSLACGILRVVEEAAARENFCRVAQIQLEIGSLASVEQQALRFALAAMMPGTCLEGSEIAISEIQGVAHCLDCDSNVDIRSHFDACPQCAGHALRATKGFDVIIADLVVFND
jgi:hydrogenase nickel incorporation protein HypA/HybF